MKRQCKEMVILRRILTVSLGLAFLMSGAAASTTAAGGPHAARTAVQGRLSAAPAYVRRRRHAHHKHHRKPSLDWHYATASWYDDGGATASGYHSYYGVANKDLAFGTRVRFCYHGRCVTATVDDRGPYVAGRDWDLNQNTAGYLGFSGVDTVKYHIY